MKKGGAPEVLVITPTRELALQILDVAVTLGDGFNTSPDRPGHNVGVLIGGTDRKTDVMRINGGMSLCIGTPGRLLDHVQNTSAFSLKKVKMLIIDEADRIFEIGFKDQLAALLDVKNGLFSEVGKAKQTLLFSATLTEEVRYLAKNQLRRNALHLVVESKTKLSDHVNQAYALMPLEDRLTFLYCWLKDTAGQKVMVFFSSCDSVRFHEELINRIQIMKKDKSGTQVAVHDYVGSLHGKKKQGQRMSTIEHFKNSKSGALFCTDVAARGLDLPSVDWVLQFDPPSDPKDYIHRIGRTGRGAGEARAEGRALLLLTPAEVPLLDHLKAHHVTMDRVSWDFQKYEKIGKQMPKLIQNTNDLRSTAKEAFKGFVLSYNAHYLKDCYDVSGLDMGYVKMAFGLSKDDKINVNLNVQRSNAKKKIYEKKVKEMIAKKHNR